MPDNMKELQRVHKGDDETETSRTFATIGVTTNGRAAGATGAKSVTSKTPRADSLTDVRGAMTEELV